MTEMDGVDLIRDESGQPYGDGFETNPFDSSLQMMNNNINCQPEAYPAILDEANSKPLERLKPEDDDQGLSSLPAGSVNLQTEDGRGSEGTTVQSGDSQSDIYRQVDKLLSIQIVEMMREGRALLYDLLKKSKISTVINALTALNNIVGRSFDAEDKLTSSHSFALNMENQSQITESIKEMNARLNEYLHPPYYIYARERNKISCYIPIMMNLVNSLVSNSIDQDIKNKMFAYLIYYVEFISTNLASLDVKYPKAPTNVADQFGYAGSSYSQNNDQIESSVNPVALPPISVPLSSDSNSSTCYTYNMPVQECREPMVGITNSGYDIRGDPTDTTSSKRINSLKQRLRTLLDKLLSGKTGGGRRFKEPSSNASSCEKWLYEARKMKDQRKKRQNYSVDESESKKVKQNNVKKGNKQDFAERNTDEYSALVEKKKELKKKHTGQLNNIGIRTSEEQIEIEETIHEIEECRSCMKEISSLLPKEEYESLCDEKKRSALNAKMYRMKQLLKVERLRNEIRALWIEDGLP